MLIKMLILVMFFTCFISYIGGDEITLVIDEWPPYSSIKLTDNGFLVRLVKESLNEVHIDLKIQSHPWTRLLLLEDFSESPISRRDIYVLINKDIHNSQYLIDELNKGLKVVKRKEWYKDLNP